MLNLKKARTEKKLTQADIATYLDVSRPTYTRYENGEREPDNNTLARLADYFDVTVDYLLGREEQKENPTTTNDSEVLDLQDPLDIEIIEKLKKLNPKFKEIALAQLESLINHQDD